jgi:hypothetical protein
VGDSAALRIDTDADAADTAAGLSILNKGKADGLYVGAQGRSSGVDGALGIGIDVNREFGSNNEQNGAASSTGILITNWTSSTNNGVCLQMNNFNLACLAPLIFGFSNGSTVKGQAASAAGDANAGLSLFNSGGTPKVAITYGGVASFLGQPRARVFRSTATQSIPDATDTEVAFDGETTDVGAMHDNVTNNSRLTVPVGGDGTYILSCGIEFAADATGFRHVRFLKNGATLLALNTHPNLGASDVVRPSLTTAADLVAGDFVEVQVYQNSGGALDINGTNAYTTWFTATKVN